MDCVLGVSIEPEIEISLYNLPTYSLLSFGCISSSITILCWSLSECSIIATSLFIIIVIIISALSFSIFIIIVISLGVVLALGPWDRVAIFVYLVL
jgi:hypothetical protein